MTVGVAADLQSSNHRGSLKDVEESGVANDDEKNAEGCSSTVARTPIGEAVVVKFLKVLTKTDYGSPSSMYLLWNLLHLRNKMDVSLSNLIADLLLLLKSPPPLPLIFYFYFLSLLIVCMLTQFLNV